MTTFIQFCSPEWLQRCLRATVLAVAAAVAVPALVQAQGVTATLDNAASTERLIAEFGGWIGNHHDADQLITTLRSGRPTATAGAASREPATGALGYGEVRLALKLAQGALAQQGVAYPDAAQLQAALHGGVLHTAQGEQTLEGVLPLKAQGTGWATMADRYGLTTEDMLPPPGKPVVVKRLMEPSAKAKAKAGAKGKAKTSAKAKSSPKGKAGAKSGVKKATGKATKAASSKAKPAAAKK
ncbi:hypothetical protein [Rhodoferax sp.]|uniref:hypothetical protein n=1 Tax=Rhodoferax sp. TaxID=50421 RepID=UPI0025F8B216|nr:hypothetical protein [Rhodoferax sp.]